MAAMASPETEVRAAALKAVAVLGDESALLPLAKQAASAQKPESETAQESLARLRGRNVDEAFVAALEQADAPVRIELARAIAQRKTVCAGPALVKTAAAADASVRAESRKALQSVGDPTLLPQLVALVVNAPNEDERKDAGSTVAAVAKKAGDPKDRTAPVLAAIPGAPSVETKCALLSVLGQIGDDTGIPALRDALKSGDVAIKLAAIQALSVWPKASPKDDLMALAKENPASPEGAAALSGFIRLLGLPSDRPVGETVKLYQDAMAIAPNAAVKGEAVAGLSNTKNAAALPPLYVALNDADDAVKTAAIKALSDWPDAAPLRELGKIARESANPLHGVLALRGYVRLIGLDTARPAEETAKMYEEAMNLAKTPDDKKGVLSGLSNTTNIAALRIAAAYLGDEALKAEAEVAVSKIAKTVAGGYPQEVKPVLEKIVQNSQNDFPVQQAKEVLGYLDKLEEYATAWQVAGPYTKEGASGKDLFDAAFPPETPDAAGVTWQMMPVGTNKNEPFLLELDKLWKGDNRAGYLRTFVWMDKAQNVHLEIGSDDGVKVWLNGNVVHANNASRACQPNEDKVDVSLNQGWNTLLMKVTQGGGEWSACARFRTSDGAKVEGLRFEATPPER